jgi:hypothetical protein
LSSRASLKWYPIDDGIFIGSGRAIKKWGRKERRLEKN